MEVSLTGKFRIYPTKENPDSSVDRCLLKDADFISIYNVNKDGTLTHVIDIKDSGESSFSDEYVIEELAGKVTVSKFNITF